MHHNYGDMSLQRSEFHHTVSENPSPSPVSMESPSIGLREIALLVIAGAYALMMFNLTTLAVLAGWLAVGIWLYIVIRGPRPSGTYTAVLGAALFFMTMWWPEDGGTSLAIPLLWVGVCLLVLGIGQRFSARRSSGA